MRGQKLLCPCTTWICLSQCWKTHRLHYPWESFAKMWVTHSKRDQSNPHHCQLEGEFLRGQTGDHVPIVTGTTECSVPEDEASGNWMHNNHGELTVGSRSPGIPNWLQIWVTMWCPTDIHGPVLAVIKECCVPEDTASGNQMQTFLVTTHQVPGHLKFMTGYNSLRKRYQKTLPTQRMLR